MAVIKINLGGMRVRINVLGGMAVICRLTKGYGTCGILGTDPRGDLDGSGRHSSHKAHDNN
jgi:hypothetical protein